MSVFRRDPDNPKKLIRVGDDEEIDLTWPEIFFFSDDDLWKAPAQGPSPAWDWPEGWGSKPLGWIDETGAA